MMMRRGARAQCSNNPGGVWGAGWGGGGDGCGGTGAWSVGRWYARKRMAVFSLEPGFLWVMQLWANLVRSSRPLCTLKTKGVGTVLSSSNSQSSCTSASSAISYPESQPCNGISSQNASIIISSFAASTTVSWRPLQRGRSGSERNACTSPSSPATLQVHSLEPSVALTGSKRRSWFLAHCCSCETCRFATPDTTTRRSMGLVPTMDAGLRDTRGEDQADKR
mmetsp:Transcript_53080/g.113348  ORF Transcript_53080/g.113348 Transcript_53080/m.113348 type:complete len:222 (+) Transcript_53080:495-1160(+)